MLSKIDDQTSRAIQVEVFVGRDDCGGAVFGDDGGAGVFLAWLQGFAGVYGGGKFLAVE